MGKGDGGSNPMQQFRKAEKKKQTRKNTADRVQQKKATMLAKAPDKIIMDIKRIQWAERQGVADDKLLANKRRLLEAHHQVDQRVKAEEARKQQDESVVVKGLTRMLGRPATIKPAPTPDVDESVPSTAPAEDAAAAAASLDDDIGLPPNLAAPSAPAPWLAHMPSTQPQPSIQQPPPPWMRDHAFSSHVKQSTAAPPSGPQPSSPPAAATFASRHAAVFGKPIDRASTQFMPTNMMLGRTRPAPKPAPKRRKLASAPSLAPPIPSSANVAGLPASTSAESAYDSFMAELGQ